MTNVLVRVSFPGGTKDHALLVSAHFDTAAGKDILRDVGVDTHQDSLSINPRDKQQNKDHHRHYNYMLRH